MNTPSNVMPGSPQQSQVTASAVIPGSDLTITAAWFRMHDYFGQVRVKSSVAGDVATVTLMKDGASTGQQADITCAVADRAYTAFVYITDVPAPGAHTWRMDLARGIGTGTVTAETAGKCAVSDVGEGTMT